MNQQITDVNLGQPASPEWFRLDVAEVASELNVDRLRGLDHADAERRLTEYGPNELDSVPRRPAWKRFADQFKDLMIYILVAAGVVSAFVGDWKDPIVIAIVLLINAVMGFVQENRADNALAALEGMLESIVRVRRDGQVQEVSAADLVPGDVVLMEAGDRIPADGRFVLTAATAVDESMLTGESIPVDKQDEPVGVPRDGSSPEVALADRLSVGYMNTTLTRGRAEMIVTGTGMDTEMGRLAGLLHAAEEKPTPLQEQIDELGKRLASIAAVAVTVVFVVALFQAGELSWDSVGEALVNAVALAVAAIPEGLPAVVTVTLAIGLGRLAKKNAIMKRLSSVETLGSTTVICSDKTGTLTLNQMTATRLIIGSRRFEVDGLGYGPNGKIHPADGEAALSDAMGFALTAGVLCNDAHLRDAEGVTQLVGDPTEGALVTLAVKGGVDPDSTRSHLPRFAEVPFDATSKFMATLHPHPGDARRSLVVVKGAPDVVIRRCSGGTDLQEAEEHNQELGSQGLRVLAVATRDLPIPAAEYEGDLGSELSDMTLAMLVGILDPARPEAVEAIAECKAAGIKVKMITGDHPSTAGAIAQSLGIEGRVVTGADLDRLDSEELVSQIDGIGACARVSPEHKVRVVKALQSTGNVVAMTGDGVNDAASLKQAEIGVAMGINGTEVTKEAGDMILADDNFATIVHAVEGGRATYENIVTFVKFQLTTNISAIGTILAAQLAGFGTIFNAIQILFVNIIADGPPAIALGVDPPKPGVMSRPPRQRDDPILSADRLTRIVISSAIITIGTIALFMAFKGSDRESALTMAFSSFVFFQLVNSFCVRAGDRSVFSRHSLSNKSLLLALAAVVVMQVIVVEVPFMREVFETTSLSASQWGWVVVTPLSLLMVEELRKAIVKLVTA